jgi:phospholipase/carboxylesterase
VTLECRTVAPSGAHRRTVIWFHGMGEGPGGYVELAQRLGLARHGVRSVVPLAPDRHLSMSGQEVPAWFQQDPLEIFEAEPRSLEAAIDAASRLVQREARDVPPEDIVLCGFSQGAALAMIVGLRCPQRLGGIALFAPYPLNQSALRNTRSAASLTTPLWIGHGLDDRVVPIAVARKLSARLAAGGYAVDLNLFAGGHDAFCGVGAGDLGRFILPAAVRQAQTT